MSILELARLTLIELWRRRLTLFPFAVAVLAGLALMLRIKLGAGDPVEASALGSLSGLLAAHVFPAAGQIVGMLAGAGAIANEVERGTVLLLAIKLPRWGVVLGKALGVYTFILGVFVVWTLEGVVGWLITGGDWKQVGGLVLVSMLGALPACLVAAIALAFSARAGSFIALGGTLVLLIGRLVESGMKQVHALDARPVLDAIANCLEAIVPVDRLGDIALLASNGHALDNLAAAALLAPLGWLALAVALFGYRDLTAQL